MSNSPTLLSRVHSLPLACVSHNDEPRVLENHLRPSSSKQAASNRALLRLVYVKELGTVGVDSLATIFAGN